MASTAQSAPPEAALVHPPPMATTDIVVPMLPTEPSSAPPSASSRKATCEPPGHGLGTYGDWVPLDPARLLVPQPPPEGRYDLVLHFHGGGTAGLMLAPLDLGLVIATLDAGVGSQRYAEAMPDAAAFDRVLASVDEALPPSAERGRLIVTSWSAGYGAVRQLLLTQPDLADAVVLLDGLHTGFQADGSLHTAGLESFVAYATRAADRDRVMVVTHSSIRPPGYASTTQTADYLLDRVGGRRSYAALQPLAGVEQLTGFSEGNLIVRGFTGTSKEAHCAQLHMIADVIKGDVLPRLSP